MTLGSLFSGCGALDLAVEHALGATTAWQVEADAAARATLARHWPDVDRSCVDVRQARDLPRVNVVAGGFPCQDLSVANSDGEGLEGARSGLYFAMERVIKVQRPALVVIENVPPLLRYRATLDARLGALGYGLRWVRFSALGVGAPHLRRRVLVVGVRGAAHRPGELVSEPTPWQVDGRQWPTASASNSNDGESLESWADRRERVAAYSRPISPPRPWPTAAATDYKGGAPGQRRGQLGEAIAVAHPGLRLSPAWVEALMGAPVGWTDAAAPGLLAEARDLLDAPRWPRGRPPAGYVGEWPGYAWEPPRVMRPEESGKGRPDRLRQLGNAVVPHAVAAALRLALDAPAPGQLALW